MMAKEQFEIPGSLGEDEIRVLGALMERVGNPTDQRKIDQIVERTRDVVWVQKVCAEISELNGYSVAESDGAYTIILEATGKKREITPRKHGGYSEGVINDLGSIFQEALTANNINPMSHPLTTKINAKGKAVAKPHHEKPDHNVGGLNDNTLGQLEALKAQLEEKTK